MQIKYIGDPARKGEGPSEIEQYGITFQKGQFVTVADEYRLPGSPTLDVIAKFKGNPTFEVKAGEAPKTRGPTAKEIKEAANAAAEPYRLALTARGVEFPAKADAVELRALLVEHVEAHPEDENDSLPPIPDEPTEE